MIIRQNALTALIALFAATGINSFSPVAFQRHNHQSSAGLIDNRSILQEQSSVTNTILWMSESSSEEETTDASAEAAASSDGEDEPEEEEGEGEEEEEEEEEPAEDPEVTALKKEIAELETALKGKKSTLAYTKEQAEEYSKAGYARKVAEMENMRRRRSSMTSSSKSSATAGILSEFLPIYDQMSELNTKFADNEFGSKYGGLSLEPTFAKMGVTQYEVSPGDRLDRIRMDPHVSEYSTEFEKDTVITALTTGMELDGNVVRPVKCVVSLGAEPEEEEEEEEEGEDDQVEEGGDAESEAEPSE